MPPKKQVAANPKKRKADQISSTEPQVMMINTSSQTIKQSTRSRKFNSNSVASSLTDSLNDTLTLKQQKTDQIITLPSPMIPPQPAQPLLLMKRSSKSKEETKHEEVKGSPLVNYPNLSKFFKPKHFTNHSSTRLASIVKYVEVTILELAQMIREEVNMKHRKDGEFEENCPICKCELYDGLHEMITKGEDKKLEDQHQLQITQQVPIDVIIMNKCTDHCYHKECLEMQLGKEDNLRCAVCSQIYGILTGKMPTGQMNWSLDPHMDCAGYPQKGSWVINYHFPNGKGKNGYRGTSRTGYLPNTNEGKRVLALLVKAFERKHTFIVGDSVTTGQKNCVVWSGIHHKTSPNGGTFGYPDPTYLNRVTHECADRGVTLDSEDEIAKIVNNSVGNRSV